jgi:hypothetical protein
MQRHPTPACKASHARKAADVSSTGSVSWHMLGNARGAHVMLLAARCFWVECSSCAADVSGTGSVGWHMLGNTRGRHVMLLAARCLWVKCSSCAVDVSSMGAKGGMQEHRGTLKSWNLGAVVTVMCVRGFPGVTCSRQISIGHPAAVVGLQEFVGG